MPRLGQRADHLDARGLELIELELTHLRTQHLPAHLQRLQHLLQLPGIVEVVQQDLQSSQHFHKQFHQRVETTLVDLHRDIQLFRGQQNCIQ